MFTGLERGFGKRETVAGTLMVERAGTVPVRFDVESVGDKQSTKDAAPGHARHETPGMEMH